MESASDSAMHQHRHEGDQYRRIELITGVGRRRRWTAAEKAALVAESLQPGVNVSELARRRGVNRGLLQTWRRRAMREAMDRGGAFVPLRIEEASAAATSAPPCPEGSPVSGDSTSAAGKGLIEIEDGPLRVRFSGPVDANALGVVLAHVGRRA